MQFAAAHVRKRRLTHTTWRFEVGLGAHPIADWGMENAAAMDDHWKCLHKR